MHTFDLINFEIIYPSVNCVPINGYFSSLWYLICSLIIFLHVWYGSKVYSYSKIKKIFINNI